MESAILAQGNPPTGIEDVPDVMAELYLEMVRFANTTPSWVQDFAGFFTEASLVLMLGLLAVTWWRARGRSAKTMAWALLAPVGLVISYIFSEWSKTFVEVDRPCRTLDVQVIAECPPVGDWSLPSNHATIAGAIAVGVLIAWPRLGLVSVVIGLLAAYSRVFVGVHYPHDIVIGFLMGAFICAFVMLVLIRPATAAVDRLRTHPAIGKILTSRAARERASSVPAPRTHGQHGGLPAYYQGDPADGPTQQLPRPK